jgi:hypothetical protein
VSIPSTDFEIPAVAATRTEDFSRLRQSAYQIASFRRSAIHRRAKARRARQRKAAARDQFAVKATQDERIKAGECKRIRVQGQFDEEKEWYFEREILPQTNDHCLVIPNVLMNASQPYLPVANTSNSPRMIRKGEILGYLQDPETTFDKPGGEEQYNEFKARAEAYSAIIAEQAGWGQESPKTTESQAEDKPSECDDDEVGPKTAALPDPTIYPSDKMRELLDVGDLPDHLQERAWEMLQSHVQAFGFDGRLGHYPGKVEIRTKEGQRPICLPMYGSSPEKRRVIDEQLDKWFELGVIEASRSPWGAPIVIAYRNGKPRFCVDYRKLNAVTTSDEFPIPRQSEILASLSGAQVLSSLDALAGFTQLEIHEDHKEKTAFRSHRGLFHFKRMPFGLKNGPSIFQRIMQGILSPFLWIFCLVYIDDIVVYSKSYEEHIDHLDKVLTSIEQSNLTLSPTKCHLFYGSILLLGHKVSRLGLSTHYEKVKAVIEMSRPRKVSELQSFIGMVVYFSTFIPFFSDICQPLFALLRKGARWAWQVEQEEAWIALKLSLQEAPVLGHPNGRKSVPPLHRRFGPSYRMRFAASPANPGRRPQGYEGLRQLLESLPARRQSP